MQTRFLELLEGLPEEVQIALLEAAYERVVKERVPGCEIINYGMSYQIFSGTYKSPRNAQSGLMDTKLAAWKDAYERLAQ